MSLPGYNKLQLSEALDSSAATLVQLVLDAIKSGQKSVKVEIEIEAKLDDEGKAVELEVELEAKEGDRSEKRELEYTVPL